jgi:hypothetical protein
MTIPHWQIQSGDRVLLQGTTRTIAGYMVPLNEDFMAETVAEFF